MPIVDQVTVNAVSHNAKLGQRPRQTQAQASACARISTCMILSSLLYIPRHKRTLAPGSWNTIPCCILAVSLLFSCSHPAYRSKPTARKQQQDSNKSIIKQQEKGWINTLFALCQPYLTPIRAVCQPYKVRIYSPSYSHHTPISLPLHPYNRRIVLSEFGFFGFFGLWESLFHHPIGPDDPLIPLIQLIQIQTTLPSIQPIQIQTKNPKLRR